MKQNKKCKRQRKSEGNVIMQYKARQSNILIWGRNLKRGETKEVQNAGSNKEL